MGMSPVHMALQAALSRLEEQDARIKELEADATAWRHLAEYRLSEWNKLEAKLARVKELHNRLSDTTGNSDDFHELNDILSDTKEVE